MRAHKSTRAAEESHSFRHFSLFPCVYPFGGSQLTSSAVLSSCPSWRSEVFPHFLADARRALIAAAASRCFHLKASFRFLSFHTPCGCVHSAAQIIPTHARTSPMNSTATPKLKFAVQHGSVAREALLARLLRTGTDAAICTLTNPMKTPSLVSPQEGALL